MLFEVCAETVEVGGGSAWEWVAISGAFERVRGMRGKLLQNKVDGLLRETAIGRQLAADDREQTSPGRVRADEMSSGYGLSVFVSGEWQRPHASVGIKDLFSSKPCCRDNAIGFAQ